MPGTRPRAGKAPAAKRDGEGRMRVALRGAVVGGRAAVESIDLEWISSSGWLERGPRARRALPWTAERWKDPLARFVEAELPDHALQAGSLRGELLGSGGELLGRGGVALCHLVHALHRLLDGVQARGL